MTKFAIVDAGCLVTGEIDAGNVTITQRGGCPAEDILRGVRHFRDPNRLAHSILNRWVSGGAGYEGGREAARENGLYVSVDDGEAIVYA